MAGPRKIFHIEETAALRLAPHRDDKGEAARHGEIMQELSALRAALTAATPSARERSFRDAPRLQVAQLTRIAHELDAVRKDSEEATQKILAAAEDVDQAANNLSAALRGEIEQGVAQDIRDRVIQIFEACNFQDLTSQRVAKVMATINNLEVQITRALDEFKRADSAPPMHGPPLSNDRGHASQTEVDALFDGVPSV